MSRHALFDRPQPRILARQSSLTIPLTPPAANSPATADQTRHDALLLQQAAKVPAVQLFLDPATLAAHTGRPTPATIWGWSSCVADPPVIYVDVAQCGTRGVAFGVLAHELTHLTHRGRRYAHHSTAWWTAVQALLNSVHQI